MRVGSGRADECQRDAGVSSVSASCGRPWLSVCRTVLKTRCCEARLAAVCDVFVTVDQNLPFQQRLDVRSFATIMLVAPSNRLGELLPLVAGLRAAIDQAQAGAVIRVAREQTVAD